MPVIKEGSLRALFSEALYRTTHGQATDVFIGRRQHSSTYLLYDTLDSMKADATPAVHKVSIVIALSRHEVTQILYSSQATLDLEPPLVS